MTNITYCIWKVSSSKLNKWHVSSNLGYGVFFFNREKQLFGMNPGQDLNNHVETLLSDILLLYG